MTVIIITLPLQCENKYCLLKVSMMATIRLDILIKLFFATSVKTNTLEYKVETTVIRANENSQQKAHFWIIVSVKKCYYNKLSTYIVRRTKDYLLDFMWTVITICYNKQCIRKYKSDSCRINISWRLLFVHPTY